MRLTIRALAILSLFAGVTVEGAAAQNLTVIQTAQTGTVPIEIAFDPGLHKMLISYRGAASVDIFDSVTFQLLATVPVGGVPHGIVVDPVVHRAFVANPGASTISEIDTATNTLVSAFSVWDSPTTYLKSPTYLAIDSVNHRLYVTHDTCACAAPSNPPPGVVSAVDSLTHEFIGKVVTLAGSTTGIAFDPDRMMVYATSYGSHLYAITADTMQLAWMLNDTGSGVVRFDDRTQRVYVGSSNFITSTVDGTAPGVRAIDPDTHAIIAYKAL